MMADVVDRLRNTSTAYKVLLLLVLVGGCIGLVGFSTAYWTVHQHVDCTVPIHVDLHMGLWEMCGLSPDRKTKVCGYLEIFDWRSSEFSLVQLLEIFGVLGIIATPCCLLAQLFVRNKTIQLKLGIILPCITAVAIFAGAVLFAIDSAATHTYGYSFYLMVLAGFLFFFAAILGLANMSHESRRQVDSPSQLQTVSTAATTRI